MGLNEHEKILRGEISNPDVRKDFGVKLVTRIMMTFWYVKNASSILCQMGRNGKDFYIIPDNVYTLNDRPEIRTVGYGVRAQVEMCTSAR